MSEWMKERICEKCGKKFTLKEHGHPGAWTASEFLERRTKDRAKNGDYLAIDYCPDCKGKVFDDLVTAIVKENEEAFQNLKWWKLWPWWKYGTLIKIVSIIYGLSIGTTYYLYSLYLSNDRRLFIVLTYIAAIPYAWFISNHFLFRKFGSVMTKKKFDFEIPALIIGHIFALLVYAIAVLVFGDPNT